MRRLAGAGARGAQDRPLTERQRRQRQVEHRAHGQRVVIARLLVRVALRVVLLDAPAPRQHACVAVVARHVVHQVAVRLVGLDLEHASVLVRDDAEPRHRLGLIGQPDESPRPLRRPRRTAEIGEQIGPVGGQSRTRRPQAKPQRHQMRLHRPQDNAKRGSWVQPRRQRCSRSIQRSSASGWCARFHAPAAYLLASANVG